MIRSRTVNTIHELAAQGKSIQDIAIHLKIARNTVRKYLRHPELCTMPHPRPNRRSKLDPFKEQIKRWMNEDHCYNCEAMLPRLLDLGYTGSYSVLKAFVHPLRPPEGGHTPIRRFETEPGEQLQFDWGEFRFEHDGVGHKLSGFTAILGFSRMRFVVFVKRCDTQTMIRCLMATFEYFGGLPKAVLTDRTSPPLAGTVVQVREQAGRLSVWSAGQLIVEVAKRAQSQTTMQHPEQFRTVAPAASLQHRRIPLGHQRVAPAIMVRPLVEYDQLYGLEDSSCTSN